MGEVADLFASLGARVDASSWAAADKAIGKATSALEGLDRLADKVASSTKAAKATERAASMRERQSAAAARAIRNLEREEARSETRRMRAAEQSTARRKAMADREDRQDEARSAQRAQRAITAGAMLGGVAAYFAQRVVRSGVEFNSTMEDSKNEVAGMLSLAHKSHLVQELSTANTLVDHLRERAAKLPGTTMEYVQMLAMITQPITDAKLGIKDLEDMTVSSVIAARGLHVPWQVAARDVDQAIRGQYHSVDPFSGKVLGSIGYKGEEGRTRYNALTQAKRASEYARGLAQPQFAELGEAAGKSFSGVLSTLKDAWEYFQGAIAKPLFEAIGEQVKDLNKWLEQNKGRVMEVAEQIGGVLLVAFEALVKVFGFFMEHGDLTIAILTAIAATLVTMAAAWIAGFWPIYAVIAAVTALVYLVRKLMNYPGGISKAFRDAWEAVKRGARAAWEAIKDGFSAAVDWISDLPGIRQLIDLMLWVKSKAGFSTENQEMLQDSVTMPEDAFLEKYPQLKRLGPMPNDLVPTLSSSSGGPSTLSINVGDVNVTTQATDPVAVGNETRKAIDDRLAYHFRRTIDEMA